MSAPPNFTYRSDPIRIVFGAGAITALRAEADLHKMSRVMVLCSKSRADFARRVTAAISDRCVGICAAASPNMPREAFDRVLGDLKRLDADGFVVVGGGSPIGLAKAAAATTKLPFIAVVTTYSGSEMAARSRGKIPSHHVSVRKCSGRLCDLCWTNLSRGLRVNSFVVAALIATNFIHASRKQ